MVELNLSGSENVNSRSNCSISFGVYFFMLRFIYQYVGCFPYFLSDLLINMNKDLMSTFVYFSVVFRKMIPLPYFSITTNFI